MKKHITNYSTIVTLLLLLVNVQSFAQSSPSTTSFSAVLRKVDLSPESEIGVQVKITLLANSASGNAVYAEEHVAITNKTGNFTVLLGKGTPSIGTWDPQQIFKTRIWQKTEIKKPGGNFEDYGTAEINAVPFAFKAANAIEYAAGVGIGLNNGLITNTAPDKIVTLTQGANIKITGTYPNFTIDGITTSQNITAGKGIIINSNVVSANINDTIWNAKKIMNVPVTNTMPKTGELLGYNGVSWAPVTGNQSIKVINASNYKTVTINAGDVVKIEGEIILSGNWQISYFPLITFIGGKITNNNTNNYNIAFASPLTFINTTFENVAINGQAKFMSCYFNGKNKKNMSYIGSYNSEFTNCVFDSVKIDNEMGSMASCTVKNSRIYGIDKINNCDFSNDSIFRVYLISNSRIGGSTIGVNSGQSGGSIICNNNLFGYCKFFLKDFQVITMTGNYFNRGLSNNQAAQLDIDCSNPHNKSMIIQGNHFDAVSVTNAIKMYNTGNSAASFTLIQNNTFTGGGTAISYSTNTNTKISGNLTRQISFGVSHNGSNLIVTDNTAF